MKYSRLHLVDYGIGLFLGLILLGGLQYHTWGTFADPDGFYHAKSAQLVNAGQLNDTFPWLYFTTWNEGYANQHYLYHWLLSPFSTVDRLPYSIVLFGLVFVGLFLLVLKTFKIRFKAFWVLLLLTCSVDFLFRINLVKANTVSLSLLCLIAILVYRFHYQLSFTHAKLIYLGGIGLVSGIFVWTYGGFVFLPFLLAAYTAAVIISERSLRLAVLKNAFLPLAVSVLGIALGMVLHPQSHHLATLMYDQLFRTGLGAGSVVPAGNEWLAFNIDWFFESNVLILIPWLLSMALFVYSFSYQKTEGSKKDFTLTLWLQFTVVGLLILTLWHRRFVEYWIPFTVLATALTLQQYLFVLKWDQFKESLKSWQMKVGVLMLIILYLALSVKNIQDVDKSLRNGSSATAYEDSSEWLKENSKAGDIVLNTQWDQFPQLFYYNDKDFYIVGLDPTFMFIQNSGKYWLWRYIADDNPEQWDSIEKIHEVVKVELQSKFVFLEKDRNRDLYNYIRENDANEILFGRGFENDEQAVFVVN